MKRQAIPHLCRSETKAGEDDVRKLEPICPELGRRKKWLKFADINKSIQELRAIFKVHPEWFETPKPKSVKGKNEVDYFIS